jgi:hypothetical protein
MTVSRELARCKLDLVGGGTEPAGEYKFFYVNGE